MATYEILKETTWTTQVTRINNRIIKKQPKTLCDNEWWALDTLRGTLVPDAMRTGKETIDMEYIERTPVTDWDLVFRNSAKVLVFLSSFGIRHGDITPPHILIRNHMIYLIDWSECRHMDDPRPDKRPEGDTHWLMKSLEEMRDAAT